MKSTNFQLDDDENVEEKTEKTIIQSNLNSKQLNKAIKPSEKQNLVEKKKKKVLKKESLLDSKTENMPFEEQECIEFVLMDFRQPEELNKFSNMKSLSLVQQNIKSLNDIACCASSKQIEFLCLNENLIESFKGIEKFLALKDLQVNFNFIEKIEYLDKLKLEKLWICENKIHKIENLPKTITSLWIATNFIEELDENLIQYEKLTELNLSANLLSSFKDLFTLSHLKNLEILNLNDPNFGENPICLINNYRLYLLHRMPYLKILDEVVITKEEIDEFENVYLKKSVFYKNKIKQLNRISKMSFKLLKTFGWFFKMMKILQIYFFRKRIKMLQYIQYERLCQNLLANNSANANLKASAGSFDKSITMNDLANQELNERSQVNNLADTHNNENNNKENDKNLSTYIYINSNNALIENLSSDELIEEMNKEIEITNDKIKKCFANFQMIDLNYYQVKNYISEVNDFSIISNFYELESGGNLKLEPGYSTDKWASSCIELVKNRLSQNFLSKHSIKGINVMKVWKITNKPKKTIFDNNYDYLVDLNNKFGDEKKYYDFFFLFLDDMSIENITKKIFDNFKFNEKNEDEQGLNSNKKTNQAEIVNILKENELCLLSAHMDKLEEFKLNNFCESNSDLNLDYASSFNNNNNNNNSSGKSKKLYTVICKCINFESLIKKSSEKFDEENHSFSDLLKACRDFAEKKSTGQDSIESCILEIPNFNKEKSIFITKNKSVFIPEYLLEYNYAFNNININLNSLSKSESKFRQNNKLSNIYNSSYISKEINSFLLKDDYIQVFNNSLRNLNNSEVKKYVPKEILENYSSCKFQFIDEMNTTELFFSKNTILNFLHTSHKYSNAESFNEEFNKILEKLDEIKNLNFKNPIISLNSNKNNISPLKSRNNNLLNNSINNTSNNNQQKKEFNPRNSIDLNANSDLNNSYINRNQMTKSRNNSSNKKENQMTEAEDFALEVSFNKIDKTKIIYLNLFQSNINDATLKLVLDSLKSTKSLKVLSLAFNNLKQVDLLETIRNFEELTNIDLSNNQISSINSNKEQFDKYEFFNSKLEILDISFNCVQNFYEILDLINLAYKAKIPNSNTNNNISPSILLHLAYFSFFGNPFPQKICDYLFQQENINLFNLNLNYEKPSASNVNKSKKNSDNNSQNNFDFEKFVRDLKLILKNLQMFKGSSNQEELEEEKSIITATTEVMYKTEEKGSFNLNQIKKLNLNININENIVISENKNKNALLINLDKPIKTEGDIVLNYITIEKLKKSEHLNRIIKYNLIDNLKQFNVIYHTYSFKKITTESGDNNNLDKFTGNDFITKNYQNEINEESFNSIFQEKVDKDKSSNVLLLSKQKLTSIPIISKSQENENQVDLILLIPSAPNLKIKYDLESQKSIKIIFLNINKLSNLLYLDQFSELEELYLQNNKLKFLPNFSMKNLKKLDISNNSLISLKNISYLKNLVYFNCENNLINNLNLTEMLELDDLAELNVSGNNIYNLKECILLKNMKKIFNLDLSGNEVCNNNEFRITLINYLQKLKILNRIPIDKNELVAAKEYFEGRITNELLEIKIGSENTFNVKELDLSNNKLKDFDNIFSSSNFLNLKKLDLSRNIFSNFKIFGYLPSLVELYLNSNLFERMLLKKDKPITNRGILGLPNLEILEICDNNISDLTGIQALKNLKTLVLRENNINKIDSLDGLINLQYLDLSCNKLRNVERSNIGLLPNLNTLICDSNYLKNINSFSKLQSLSYISFDSNKIAEISNIERLAEIESLKELNLNNNPITKNINYRVNVIRKFYNLSKIDGQEITKDEREIAIMDQTCQPQIQGVEQIHPSNIYMAKLENTKMAMKVNFVNLDLMMGNGGLNIVSTKIMNHDENQHHRDKNISPIRAASMEPQYGLSLPHINNPNMNQNSNHNNKQISFNTKNRKNPKQFSSNNNLNQIQNMNNNNNLIILNNKNNIKNQKVKITNLPLGNLFKQIGEVISGGHQNENLANLISKLGNQNRNFPIAQYDNKPPSRPKSITYRKYN